MKKIFVICFLLFLSVSLFSQGHNYGLLQDDLNLLLGEFVPNEQIPMVRWFERSFSWGRQPAIDTNGDMVRVDYSNRFTSRLGIEYENHLVFFNSGLIFVIRNIEKKSTDTFILSLGAAPQHGDLNIKDVGQIVITFLDDRHMIISNINYIYGFIFGQQWWKSAGPTVTND
jgi:hypothetical protein